LDKFYYIIKKKGNNPEFYFYSLKLEECPMHKTYFCGCVKNKSEREVIQKYIYLYKYTSQIITFTNGKIKYIKKKTKDSNRFSSSFL